jgi:hypothetical protein
MEDSSMRIFTSEEIGKGATDVAAIVNHTGEAKGAKERLVARLADLADRMQAIELACRIMDDAKGRKLVGKRATGEKITTKIINGVKHETVATIWNDTTSNAKGRLASCVNQAYEGYPDTVTLVTHKTSATTYKLEPIKVVDRLVMATEKLIDLLPAMTTAEADSFRFMVSRLSLEGEATETIHTLFQQAESAYHAKMEAAKMEAAKMEAAQAFEDRINGMVVEAAREEGIKAGTAAYKAMAAGIRRAMATSAM